MKPNAYPGNGEEFVEVLPVVGETAGRLAVEPSIAEYTGADDAGDALSVEQVTLGTYGGPGEDDYAGYKGN